MSNGDGTCDLRRASVGSTAQYQDDVGEGRVTSDVASSNSGVRA